MNKAQRERAAWLAGLAREVAAAPRTRKRITAEEIYAQLDIQSEARARARGEEYKPPPVVIVETPATPPAVVTPRAPQWTPGPPGLVKKGTVSRFVPPARRSIAEPRDPSREGWGAKKGG